MDFRTYPSAAPFLEAVEADLVADEVSNNLMYGLALQAARSPGRFYTPPYFATVTEGGRLRAAAMMTPPNNLIVMAVEGGEIRAAMDRLANGLCESPWPGIPGVIGPTAPAIAFSQAWVARTGVKSSLRIHERLYELRTGSLPRSQ